MKWEMVRLGDALDYEQPTKYIVKNTLYHESYTTPVLTAGKNFLLGYTNEQEGIFTNVPVIIFDDFTTSTQYVDFPFKVKSSAMKILKAKKNNSIKYLYYKLQTISVDSELHKRYWLSIFSNILIPLPPLDEQIRIADALDKADAIVQKRKESLALADEYIKSVFIDMFGDPVTNPMGWEVKKLQNLSSLITKGASPNWQGFDYTTDSSQTLFITSENVREKYLSLEKMKFLPNTFNQKQPRSVLKKGDFLINIVGASIGRAAMFNLDVKANINQAVALVRLQENKISEHYLLHYLNSDKALKMYSDMQVSVARANLSLQNISDLEIICPPLPLQEKFAKIVEKVEKTKEKMQKQLDEAENLFKALQQEFFG